MQKKTHVRTYVHIYRLYTGAIHFLRLHSIAETLSGYIFCRYSGRNLTSRSRGIPTMLAANLARISVAEIAPIFAKSILLRQYFACCSDIEFDEKKSLHLLKWDKIEIRIEAYNR